MNLNYSNRFFEMFFHYTYIEKSRNQENFRNYDEFVMKGNENSRIIVINAKNSNLSSIKKDDDYLNEIYKSLYFDYGIDIKNINVYFVWDRDRFSNPKEITRDLLSKLGNSLENKNGEMNGLLLLSYPCMESFILSNFDKKTLFLKDMNLKKYLKQQEYRIANIDRYTLLKATAMMNHLFRKFDVFEYNLDDFSKTSLKIFDQQEKIFKEKTYYYFLSFISIIFLDLNIITMRDVSSK